MKRDVKFIINKIESISIIDQLDIEEFVVRSFNKLD